MTNEMVVFHDIMFLLNPLDLPSHVAAHKPHIRFVFFFKPSRSRFIEIIVEY